MASPIIKIKRGTTVPSAGQLQAGEFAIDQLAKNLYLGIDDGSGNITNEVVGGEGTFATKAYVATALGGVSGTLGTMATQNANNVAITGGTVDGTAIGATAASTGKFTSLDVTTGDIVMSGSGLIDMNAGRITNLSAPVNNNDAVRKTDLDSAISALGSVFHYVGDVSSATGNDLDTLSDTATGAYYKVDVAGIYTAASGFSVNAKVGDAFVKTTTGWQKLDNVDAVVSGTANEIAVTGDENAGYTVAIDPVFSGRVSDVEGKTQHISATAATSGPASGSTSILGGFEVGAPLGGSMIKIAPTSLDLELNLLGNSSVKSHATLELVDSSWGLPTGAGGGYSIKADGRIMTSAGGLDVTGDSTLNGNLSVTGNITDALIDGGVY